ncbi:TasA family protein [Cuneatibacter caecimuris]|uniref:Camelysin-like metallo-endopeptidase n=1 Tax=Cuneatibacter caecimuris TaxID=1796618 RepID=A0A4Q7P3C3_9FIRM|nr:TasA family protein [Cuneatibacter caecimuris]RZS94315.1 camelysin-like metallo-endopeptidase [Cuneatibacter caecimuris]
MNMRKKTIALLTTLVLALGCIIGGTVAWLTARTNQIVNTFTTSNIDITLEETTGMNYKMVPGHTIAKNPKAAVIVGSEECYLFVMLEKSANFDSYLAFEMADGWIALDNVEGVYYRTVTASQMGTEYSVLKDDQVSVKGTVTKEMMDTLSPQTDPILSITAYASQLHKNSTEDFTAAEAWTNIGPASQN